MVTVNAEWMQQGDVALRADMWAQVHLFDW